LKSSRLKAAIVSGMRDVRTLTYEPHETILLPDSGAEQDAEQWWTITLKASKKVIADSGVAPEQVVGICCDTQYGVILPVNEHAEPLMNAVSWLDTRGGKHNQKLVSGFLRMQGMSIRKLIKFIRLTGIAPTTTGINSLAHMLFIKNELP
jgi:xylulokinase